jgi:hypothetical protein
LGGLRYSRQWIFVTGRRRSKIETSGIGSIQVTPKWSHPMVRKKDRNLYIRALSAAENDQ